MYLKMKIFSALIVLVIYFTILCLIYYLHIQYFRVNVVFYSAIFDSVLASIIILLILKYGKSFAIYNNFEKTQLITICLIVGYCLSISVPTVIDRSLSFYILEKIDQRGGGIQTSGFEEVFTKEYVKEHRLVDVRLTEQRESGTIKIQNGCVTLTKRGETLVAFSRFFRRNFLPKQRLLMGQYSDDLTHPFDNNLNKTNYKCN